MARLQWYDENTLVIRTKQVLDYLAFFNALGLTFKREQHGDGPWHYACQVDNTVLEIYPAN
jgi:hypothetical protein